MTDHFPIVRVVWDDAHVTTDEKTIKQAGKMQPVRTYTVGYLLAETEHGVVMATDVYPEDKKSGRIVNFIGWGMIVEYEQLVI